MSHFVVMVTNTDEYGLESQLEPFYEQGDESDYFMKRDYYLRKDEEEIQEWLKNEISNAEIREKDALKEFEKELPDTPKEELEKEIDRLSKESALDQLSQTFDNVKLGSIARRINWAKSEQKRLKNIQQLDNLNKKLKAIKEFNGGGLDRDGLYWVYNPEARWDSWVIGGRWNNWLVTKNGDKCNSCKIKDLDFEKMRQSDMEDRARYYDEEMKRAKETGGEPFFWGYKEVPTREEYINDTPKYVSPFAVLHNEEWIEKGSMGWFGMSDDKYTDEEWGKKFQEFIESLDPETEVTIVDCHI